MSEKIATLRAAIDKNISPQDFMHVYVCIYERKAK